MNFVKYLIFFVGTLIISTLLTYIGSWWLIIVGPMLFAFFLKIPYGKSFLAGAISIMLFWTSLMVMRSEVSGGQITEKIALLLPLHGSRTALCLVTLLVGGLIGGLAGLNGSYWRRSFDLTR